MEYGCCHCILVFKGVGSGAIILIVASLAKDANLGTQLHWLGWSFAL